MEKAAQLPVSDHGAAAVSGRWTAEEHEAFCMGLEIYGREWKKVAKCVPTRTPAQIRSHAQKYFDKVSKEQQSSATIEPIINSSVPLSLALSTKVPAEFQHSPNLSRSYREIVNDIVQHPEAIETRVQKALQSLRNKFTNIDTDIEPIHSSGESQTIVPMDTTNTTSVGPASAALELEQKNLRKAAEARHEKKKLEQQLSNTNNHTEKENPHCARVSLASISSRGAFDSSEVLALSSLGDSLNKNTTTTSLGKKRKTEFPFER